MRLGLPEAAPVPLLPEFTSACGSISMMFHADLTLQASTPDTDVIQAIRLCSEALYSVGTLPMLLRLTDDHDIRALSSDVAQAD